MPSTHCVACSDPAIDAASRDGSRANRALAREFNISEAAVRRHRANHVATERAAVAQASEGAGPTTFDDDRRGAGRVSKYTPEREQRLLDALRAGNTRQAACQYAGISDETFAQWLGSRQRKTTGVDTLEFLEAVKKAEADAEVRHVANIAKAASEGTWQASAWWLERRRPDNFGRRDRVELTLRQQAEKLAADLGLDAAELLAEAEHIIAGR